MKTPPTPSDPLGIHDLRAFVPATDFALSKAFYQTLGFTLTQDYGDVCEFELGGFCFLLQDFSAPGFAGNFMMHLLVQDVDAWWRHIQQVELLKHFPTAKAQAPAVQPWGLKVLFLHDPSGVLWHIAQD
jgi:catechol 2,3-dioxygenase-like lactoylglutathione lyase family enzyme